MTHSIKPKASIAKVAQDLLIKNNFSHVEHLTGDYPEWEGEGLSIEKGSIFH